MPDGYGDAAAGNHPHPAELRRELTRLTTARTYEKQSGRIAIRPYTWNTISATPARDAEGHSAYAVAFADRGVGRWRAAWDAGRS